MYKICTSIDQSKKLIELGIDVKTADMFWSLNPEVLVPSEYMTEDNCIPCVDAIPAWSLSALLGILPDEISTGEGYQNKYEIKIRRHYGGNNITLYQIAYSNDKGSGGAWHDMISTSEQEKFVDVCYEMICWLKENGKI